MKKVAVVTGTRAEYGLLKPVLNAVRQNTKLQLQLYVTGAHLSDKYGRTVSEIEADGFTNYIPVPILQFGDDALGTAQTIALAVGKFAQLFSENAPDALLVLGDRYEIFAATTAAATLNIPVAHISGGDVTYGAQDEFFRHSITKMAKLHFTSCDVYKKRVIAMGEAPATVFNVGGLGDENIRAGGLLSKKALFASLNIKTKLPFAVVTYHPETATGINAEAQFAEVLEALAKFSDELFIIFTLANADAGGGQINAMIKSYCGKNANTAWFASLGAKRYLSAMKHCAVVIGNSSSGIAEAPSLKKPAVNIGKRQQGRLMAGNIINTKCEAALIERGITKAISKRFSEHCKQIKSPYNKGATSAKIVLKLEQFLYSGALDAPKTFYDVKTK